MTPDLTNLEARIDKEKRDRERELLALLLLLLLRTRQYGDAAIRLGSDPFAAMAAVIMGNRLLGLPGGIERLAAILAAADSAGFRRTQLVLPGDAVQYQPGTNYRQTAGIALAQLLSTLQRRVGQAFAAAKAGTQGLRQALREAFRTGGYVEAGPAGAWQLSTVAETVVGNAYGTGYWQGWGRPGLPQLGFRYSSVLDDRRTEICKAYEAVQLPREHPWWLSHWPLNHWRCRSVVLPIVGAFVATENPPYTPPPMAGFGRAPFAAFNLWRPAA